LAPSPTFSPTTAVNEFVYELIPWFFFNGGKIPLPNDSIYKNIADTVEKSEEHIRRVTVGRRAVKYHPHRVEKSEEHIRRVTVEMLKKVESMLIENLESCRGHVLIDAEV
jgi:hypothetical protein